MPIVRVPLLRAGPAPPCAVRLDPVSAGQRALGSNVYEEKQSYATGTAYLKTVTRTWDAVGNKATEAYPSGLALAYTWTDVNQLDTISDGSVTLADYAYKGRLRKDLVYGNSAKTVFSYTGFRGEVATIDHQDNAGGTILRLDYGYNKLHDRTYERYGSSGSAGDAFEYDKARRLTTAWMGSATPTAPSGAAYVTKIQYNMDDDGNRTSVVTTPYGVSPTTVSYTDNNLNQYTAVGGTSRSHDGNGNVTDDGTYTYQYNYKNLIVKATRKSDSAVVGEYRYDALGRRVEKVVTGATYRYIYSGVETVSVYTSTGTWKQDYVYGPVIDEVIMLEQADLLDADCDSNTSEPARSWYMRNALGSVMLVEEQDRTEAVTYRYDPYGSVTITRGGTGQSGDPLGQHVTYTGRWRDEETGLYHYRARAYDSVRGGFPQRDPLGPVAGANLYAYAAQSPISRCDPLGLLDTINGDEYYRGPIFGPKTHHVKPMGSRSRNSTIECRGGWHALSFFADNVDRGARDPVYPSQKCRELSNSCTEIDIHEEWDVAAHWDEGLMFMPSKWLPIPENRNPGTWAPGWTVNTRWIPGKSSEVALWMNRAAAAGWATGNPYIGMISGALAFVATLLPDGEGSNYTLIMPNDYRPVMNIVSYWHTEWSNYSWRVTQWRVVECSGPCGNCADYLDRLKQNARYGSGTGSAPPAPMGTKK